MENDVLLKVENLKKCFPMERNLFSSFFPGTKRYLCAVDDVSFALREQEILGIVGESGCGKTTLARLILCLEKNGFGNIWYQNEEITSLNRKKFKPFRHKMQMIFQDPFGSLNPARTVADTLRQTIRIHGLAGSKDEEEDLIRYTLEEVELKPADHYKDKYPGLLSGGQLQRVSIARVLILRPDLVIADEAVSMLDVSVRADILDVLLRMRNKFGISFIYITHDIVTARYICDRIAIMYTGRIVEIGETETILNNPLHPYTQALIAAVPVPDPSAEIQELPIKGYVSVSPNGRPHQCHFYTRCPYAMKKCREQRPRLVQAGEAGEDHYAACFKL